MIYSSFILLLDIRYYDDVDNVHVLRTFSDNPIPKLFERFGTNTINIPGGKTIHKKFLIIDAGL